MYPPSLKTMTISTAATPRALPNVPINDRWGGCFFGRVCSTPADFSQERKRSTLTLAGSVSDRPSHDRDPKRPKQRRAPRSNPAPSRVCLQAPLFLLRPGKLGFARARRTSRGNVAPSRGKRGGRNPNRCKRALRANTTGSLSFLNCRGLKLHPPPQRR